MNDIKTVENRRKNKHIVSNGCIVVLICMILGYMVGAMHSSENWNLNKFFDTGDVYELGLRKNEAAGITYQYNDYFLKINEEYATISFTNSNTSIEWRYLYFYTENIPADKLDAELMIYDEQEALVYHSAMKITEGENAVAVCGDKINKITFVFKNEAGIEFNLYKIQLRENIKYVSGGTVLSESAVFFIIFLALFAGIDFYCKYKKIQLKKIPYMEMIQQIYLELFQMVRKKTGKISEKSRSILRKICLLTLFSNLLITTKYGDYLQKDYYKYYITVQLLLLILWSMTNAKCRMRIISGNNRMLNAWGIFCILMCISDFVVEKKFAYTGMWMLVIFTLVFFSWNNMKNPTQAIEELYIVIRILLIVSCVYCLFFEKYMGFGYIGMTNNPNTLGEFMAMICAIEYTVLDERLYNTDKRFLANILELILALTFIEMSDCRASKLVFEILTISFLVKAIGNFKDKRYRRNVLTAVVIFGIAYLPISTVCSWTAANLPGQSIEKDIAEEQMIDRGETVYASTLEQRMLYEKLDVYSSGRIRIWQNYLSELNLWGHYGDADIDGAVDKKIGAHNMFITIAYRYGIFSVVPYIFLILGILKYGFCYMIKMRRAKGSYALMILFTGISYFGSAFLGNMEQPLRYMPWVIFYMMIGYTMIQAENMDEIEEAGE